MSKRAKLFGVSNPQLWNVLNLQRFGLKQTKPATGVKMWVVLLCAWNWPLDSLYALPTAGSRTVCRRLVGIESQRPHRWFRPFALRQNGRPRYSGTRAERCRRSHAVAFDKDHMRSRVPLTDAAWRCGQRNKMSMNAHVHVCAPVTEGIH